MEKSTKKCQIGVKKERKKELWKCIKLCTVSIAKPGYKGTNIEFLFWTNIFIWKYEMFYQTQNIILQNLFF